MHTPFNQGQVKENRFWSAYYENPFDGSLYKSKKILTVKEAFEQFS